MQEDCSSTNVDWHKGSCIILTDHTKFIKDRVEVSINNSKFMVLVGEESFSPWIIGPNEMIPDAVSEPPSAEDEDWEFESKDEDIIMENGDTPTSSETVAAPASSPASVTPRFSYFILSVKIFN